MGTTYNIQTCEDVGANQPGPGGETDTGQQGEGVQGQAMENNELEDVWPNCQNKSMTYGNNSHY